LSAITFKALQLRTGARRICKRWFKHGFFGKGQGVDACDYFQAPHPGGIAPR
jgi:hypothetical protein